MIGKKQMFALNVLNAKKEEIYPNYVSQHNSNREKEVILLMITNGEGSHYLAVKNYQHYKEEQRVNITVIFIV